MKSYDVFDTLISRWYFEPNSIFKIMEKELQINNFCKIRKEAEFSCKEPSIDLIYEKIQKYLKLDKEEIEKIKKMEIELEHKMSFPILENMKKVQDGDILISDMYLGSKEILSILKKNGLDKDVKLYVSNDGKKNGTIWNKIDEKERIEVHLGDNFLSDVESAKRNGIKAQHSIIHMFSETEKSIYEKNHGIALLSRMCRLLNPYEQFTRNHILWNEASNYTLPIAITISNLIYDIVQEKQFENILFSTRDCVHLQKIFCALYPQFDKKSIEFHSSRKMFYNPTPEYKRYCQRNFKNSLVVDLQGTGESFKSFLNTNKYQDTYLLMVIDAGELFEKKISIFNAKEDKMSCNIEKINYDKKGTLVDFGELPIRSEIEYDVDIVEPYFEVINRACNVIREGFSIENKESKSILSMLLLELDKKIQISKFIKHVDNYVIR